MGPIPTVSDRTADALDRIRRAQDGIQSYRATITETSVTQLSNGSEMTHVQKWRVQVKYTDDGTLTRVARWSPGSPDEETVYVRNRTASVTYVPDEDEYRIDRGAGTTDVNEARRGPHLRSAGGEYRLFEAPRSSVERENAIEYNGTEQFRGGEAYVIHLDGNPNGGNLAYYDAQTLWVDAETGLVLKQTAQKPRLDSMPNVTVGDLRDPENHSIRNDSDDGPNAVYLGDKTVTTTYTNVSVNTVPDDAFTLDLPADADVEFVGDDE